MQPFTTRIKTNLNGVLQMTEMLDGIMMTGDDLANKIIVELHRDREPVVIPEGTRVIAYFIRSDGISLETDGTIIASNQVMVEIPQLAYGVSGVISIAIRLYVGPRDIIKRGYYDSITGEFVVVTYSSITVGPHGEPIEDHLITEYDNKIVVAALSCYVKATDTDEWVDPEHKIPDLHDIIQKISEMEAKAVRWQQAENARVEAENIRKTNETARQTAIQNMSVSATQRPAGSSPTATISDVDNHKHITFGIVPGIGISSAVLNDDYTLTLNYSDGTSFTTSNSIRGPKGEPGWGGAEVNYDARTSSLTVTFG